MTMPEPETAARRRGLFTDLLAAARLLTRLPLPAFGQHTAEAGLAAGWPFPLVGAAVGAAGGAVLMGTLALGLPPVVAAVAAVAGQVWLTGGLHEDGLADAADGLGVAGRTPAERIAIMRDARIGAFAVVALVLVLLLRVETVALLAAAPGAVTALVVGGALSRAALVAVAAALPLAATNGLAAGAGRPTVWSAAVALAVAGAGAAALLPPFAMGAALAACGLACGVVAALAARRLGGYTGDVLGAAQQVAECMVLAALAATLGASP